MPFVNLLISVFYCIIIIIQKADLLFNPPEIMIGSMDVNKGPFQYLITPLLLLCLKVFIVLTLFEVVTVLSYNLVSKFTGGIEITVDKYKENE